MRFGIMSVLVALAAAVVVVGSSGAVTAKQRGVAKIDVSTTSGVIHYLRSIHVSPRKVVIQRGLRNYAGAHCPGKGWNCARTRHTVVQIAKRGGQNRFACRTAKCVVIQFGSLSRGRHALAYASSSTLPAPVNTASCIKTTGVTQSCVINQPNATGTNKAVVWMDTGKLTGLTQSANYTASITQGPASASGNSSNWNLACVHQLVSIDGSATKTNAASVTVNNDAHESVLIKQNSRTGNNSVQAAANPNKNTYDCKTDGAGNPDSASAATQDQTLTSTVTTRGPITQNQDAAYRLCGDGVAGNYANLCFDVEQNQGSFKCTTVPALSCPSSGINTATFTQTSMQTAIANTTAGPVGQTQSTPLCGTPGAPANCVFPGGLVGTLNQDSSGKSTASPTQIETQCQDAATPSSLGYPLSSCNQNDPVPAGISLTQNQYGPVGVGTLRGSRHGRVPFARGKGLGQSFQIGNTDNVYTITQTSTQDNNEGTGSNQQNFGRVDCSTTGSCTAGQTTTVNGDGTGDGYTSPTISNLVINCPTGTSCTATPPPAPKIVAPKPSDPSESRDATFTWTDAATAGVTFTCSIDGTPTTCTSPASYTNLALGPHTFEVTASDLHGNTSDADSFSWTIVPYLTFEATEDGASAGWTGDVPGSSITLKVGSVPATTFGQFTLHNFEGIAIDDLAEPTFTTGTYSGGAPREEIDFSNGDYVFGYPSQAGFGTDSWQLVCDGGCVTGGFMSWADVQAAEPADTTVAAALVEADGGVPDGTTFVISAFTFDGYSLSDFTDHWH